MLFLIGIVFQSVHALTEKQCLPKELDLRGTTPSPLRADLVVLLFAFFCRIKVQSGGCALPFIILKMRHASVCFKRFSQLSRLCLSRILQWWFCLGFLSKTLTITILSNAVTHFNPKLNGVLFFKNSPTS